MTERLKITSYQEEVEVDDEEDEDDEPSSPQERLDSAVSTIGGRETAPREWKKGAIGYLVGGAWSLTKGLLKTAWQATYILGSSILLEAGETLEKAGIKFPKSKEK